MKFDTKEMHHLYIGLGLIGLGVFTLLSRWGGPTILVTGVWLFADDVWQHFRQCQVPSYRSPVNRLYGWIRKRLP